MSDRQYTAVIVEDEELARAALAQMISQVDWLRCVAEATNGREACEIIDHHEPDVVFLDVRIPEMDGLQVLDRIHTTPFVVFTTAYVDFAIPAFDKGAVDYLVKPFGIGRFRRSIDRIKERLESISRQSLSKQKRGRVFVQEGDSVFPVELEKIQSFESAGDYVVAKCGDQKYILASQLSALEEKLESSEFVRIHRSSIVNLALIERLERHDDRRFIVHMQNGEKLVASRSGSTKLRSLYL